MLSDYLNFIFIYVISFQVKSFNPFGRSTSMFAFNSRSGIHADREKEDLLTSERSHFKPISEKLDNRTQKQYADGATFVISNNLEKVSVAASRINKFISLRKIK